MVLSDKDFALLSRFLKSLGIEETSDFDMKIDKIIKSSYDKNYLTITFEKDTPWKYYLVEKFMNGLNSLTTYKADIIFIYDCPIYGPELKELISDWYFNCSHKIENFEIFVPLEENDKTINFVFNSINDEKEFNEKYLKDLKDFLSLISYNFEINLKNKEVQTEEKSEVFVPTNKDEQFEEEKKITEEEIESELKNNYERMIQERKNRNLFKKGDYQPYKIIQIDSNSEAVDINGRIFEIDFRESKTGKTIAKIGIDDGDTIYCTAISNEKTLKKEDLFNLKVGRNVRIEGRVTIDKFSNDIIIMVHYIFSLPDTEMRSDDEEEKRVELHLHTKMSDFDGVTFFEDYVKLAKHMGHKAIAITDHGNVQGFPNAQEIAKKQDIKVLYGSELYMINDKFDVTINPIDLALKDASFVCFDTETTGLNSRFNKMMEFGAVKIINGMATDRIDILINPEEPIPENIQKITNITNEMVKDKPTIKEALPEILKFIGDSILVAHNLEFDYGYLNEAMKRNGYGELKSPAIDTLKLAWYLFPEKRRFKLGSLCKFYNVPYETHDEEDDDANEEFLGENNDIEKHAAHRADYDAKVLSEVWLNMRDTICKQNQNLNLLDLTKLEMSQAFLRNYRDANHVIALIKNDKGVKELYQIISDAHINHMGNNSFTTKSFLNSHRSDLLIGSSCLNGEVFKCAMKSDYNNNLRNAIKKFDFIEIQPPENYSYLVDTDEIPSMEDVKIVLKDIIRIAKEENKLICVTGDVHYANPEDKIYRDVMISASQIGGKFHPLFSRKRANKQSRVFDNPNQHYRTTKEMYDAFDFLSHEEAKEYIVTNTNKIADMCERIVPVKTDTYTPTIEGCDEKLKNLVYENAHRLYGDPLPKLIEDRINSELKGILDNGYGVIYWIAHLLVKKANDDGYIVGSRGSVGSSIVATFADITEVNPLPPHYRCPHCKYVEFSDDPNMSGYDLPKKKCPVCGETMVSDGQSIPFETFLGFDADKTPDIDLNFPTDYQSTAHEYTKVFLGANNVYRAGTIGTMQFKTAYGLVRKYYEDYLHYTKEEIDTKIKKSKIASIAYGCVEVKRTTGQHPAGIVVVPNGYDINDFTPIQYPADDTTAAWKTTHFDFTSMHDTLLKLDILGHVDPQALKFLGDLTGVDIKTIPLADEKVLSLFTRDDALNLRHQYLEPDNGALGLPEFGTNFVRKVLRDAQPKTFQDLVIISGLTHGTNVWNGNAEDLIKNQVANLKGVIGCRDDIMVYLISKGIEKHNAFVIMETVRKKGKHLSPTQIQDMLDHDVPQYYIDSCEKIEYLFPKGHATAYVMMALRVAYFKVYYPLEYYASFFTLRCDAYDINSMCNGIDRCYNRLQELKEKKAAKIDWKEKDDAIIDTLDVVLEMYERGYKIEPISLEKSHATKFIVDKENNALIPPFKVLDGMGENNCICLTNARDERMFSSREDLLKRGGISEKIIKDLDRMHCLDKLNDTDQISLFDFNF